MGVPAHIVWLENKRVASASPLLKPVADLDQIHIPDPVSQELCRMSHRIALLEKELKKYQKTEYEEQNERNYEDENI